MKPIPTSSEPEVDALDALCERLAGFGADVSLEWLDGCLTALVAGPRTVLPGEWLPMLFGDAWGRVFADPDDVAQALDKLMRRWNVIARQLDPEALDDDPEQLRLTPLMEDVDPARIELLVAEGKLSAEQAADWPLTGEIWAAGFLHVVSALPDDWQVPSGDDEAQRVHDSALRCVAALVERDATKLQADLAIRYPGQTPSRDELIDEACYAVQDLRLLWLDLQPRPAPRRVDKAPGRNDPCPCGSGKKFKKCHGAPEALH
jgi:uncharacterized protein